MVKQPSAIDESSEYIGYFGGVSQLDTSIYIDVYIYKHIYIYLYIYIYYMSLMLKASAICSKTTEKASES